MDGLTVAVGVGLISQERFAEQAGVDVGVVTGWVRRGYVPSVAVGKYRMVNLYALHRELVGQSFNVPADMEVFG